jgi:hypothetical protein
MTTPEEALSEIEAVPGDSSLSASMQIVLSSVGLEGMMKIAYWVPP